MVLERRLLNMEQTKLSSFYEQLMNIAIGAVVALLSQMFVFPMFDINVSLQTNIYIMLWFTSISIVRGYVIRRWFNARLKRAAERLAN